MFVRSLSLGVAAAALLVGGAQAADLIIPTTPQPIYEAAGFSWDGMYAGVNLGGQFAEDDLGDNVSQFLLGGGVEFAATDAVSVRAEILGIGTFDDGDDFFEAAQATVGVFYHF